MSRDYHALVGGLGMTVERFPIDRETDDQAIDAAFAACSPFGHSLWDGRRFLGYFDAGDGREPRMAPHRGSSAIIPPLPC